MVKALIKYKGIYKIVLVWMIAVLLCVGAGFGMIGLINQKYVAVNYYVLVVGAVCEFAIMLTISIYFSAKKKAIVKDVGENYIDAKTAQKYKIARPVNKKIDLFYISKEAEKTSNCLVVAQAIIVLLICAFLIIGHVLELMLVSAITLLCVGFILFFTQHYIMLEQEDINNRFHAEQEIMNYKESEVAKKVKIFCMINFSICILIISVINVFFQNKFMIIFAFAFVLASIILYCLSLYITRHNNSETSSTKYD